MFTVLAAFTTAIIEIKLRQELCNSEIETNPTIQMIKLIQGDHCL